METTTHRPIKCKDCIRRFHSISDLQQHTRYHRRVWLYQCSVCSKSFRGLEQLKRHQVVHDKEKPLECGWCSDAFLEHYQLAIHLFRKHKIIASSIGLAAAPPDGCAPHLEPVAIDAEGSPEIVSTEGANHIEYGTGNIGDLVESGYTDASVQANVAIKGSAFNGEVSVEKNSSAVVGIPSIDMNGNAMAYSPKLDSNEREDRLYQLVDNTEAANVPRGEDRDSTDDSADINEAIMLLTGLKDADVSSEEKSSCAALEDDQTHFTLPLMTDDDSQDSAGGVVNGSAAVMMRGDPSLHCPSREDLLGLEESVAFSEECDSEKKPLEMSAMGPTWSASCGSLTGLIMSGTPHKLSVDPGAASANASPTMSPFRATIGRGDSDSESGAEPDQLPSADQVTADKESAISPGHTEASNDLPIQPSAITFTKSEQDSGFHGNLKTLTEEEKHMPPRKSSSLRDLRLVTETHSVVSRVACKKYVIKDKNSPEKELIKEKEKSPRKRRKRVAYKDEDFVYDYNELTADQKEQKSEGPPRKQSKLEKRESDLDSSSGSSIQIPIIKRKRGQRKKEDKDGNELKPLVPIPENKTERRVLSRYAKRKLATRWRNAVTSDNESDKDTEWSPEPSEHSEPESQMTSKCSSSKDSDSGLEYKLRPKRRKNYQLLADPNAIVVDRDNQNNQSLNARHFMENVAKVEDLRVLVTRLIMTVFPDIAYPNLFQEEGLSVDYLMDEIMGAMYETQRKNVWTPFGAVGDEVRVVLCKQPYACLCHLRRKAARLLHTILPEAQESCPTDGPGVEALIREVIQSNIKANSQ